MNLRTLALLMALVLFGGSSSGAPLFRYPVGEQLSYKILWGFLPVGRTLISCEEVIENNTRQIRIRVEARSNRLVSTLYPVDDQIDCYIDPDTGLPLRVEKTTAEGDLICDDTLWLDHKNLRARWESRSDSISTNYPIRPDTLDVAAFLYAMRSAPFALNESKTFNIAVDGTLHGLRIHADEKKSITIGSEKEKTPCTRFSVQPERDDLFVRKIPRDIWVSDDARRIMVKMKAKTPLGSVRIVLDEINTIP